MSDAGDLSVQVDEKTGEIPLLADENDAGEKEKEEKEEKEEDSDLKESENQENKAEEKEDTQKFNEEETIAINENSNFENPNKEENNDDEGKLSDKNEELSDNNEGNDKEIKDLQNKISSEEEEKENSEDNNSDGKNSFDGIVKNERIAQFDEIEENKKEDSATEQNASEGDNNSIFEDSLKLSSEYSDSEDFIPDYKSMQIDKVIRAIQEVILWRRPISLLFVVMTTEFMFFAIYKLHLDTLSTLFVLLIAIHIACLVYSILPKTVKDWIFPPIDEIPVDDNVVQFYEMVKGKMSLFIGWIINYIKHPNIIDSVLFIGTLILLFTIFFIIGSFWSCFIVTNCLFFLPAFFFNPIFRETVDEKITAAREAVKQKEKIE